MCWSLYPYYRLAKAAYMSAGSLFSVQNLLKGRQLVHLGRPRKLLNFIFNLLILNTPRCQLGVSAVLGFDLERKPRKSLGQTVSALVPPVTYSYFIIMDLLL